MKNIRYESLMPLARLEKGDKAIIKVCKLLPTNLLSDKDKRKYSKVPNGEYKAICIGECKLECEEYPVLSGKYNLWHGDKWGRRYGIYADEYKEGN